MYGLFKKYWTICVLIGFFSGHVARIERTDDGVIIHPSIVTPVSARVIKIQVIKDNIIRVIASQSDTFSTRKSLMVVPQKTTATWDLIQGKDEITVVTNALQAHVSTLTGEITFLDVHGKEILKERKEGGKTFRPLQADGENMYSIQQVFESPADEAFYGLGEHQNDVMNYKGHDVDLTQYNSVAVVPFVLSNKNYGILWDNYSITKFGDARDYQPLSTLQLFDKSGKAGGLTASYASKQNNAVFLTRLEKDISFEFLSDQKKYPTGYDLQNGKITWEGFIGVQKSGVQKFFNLHAGYIKVWVNGKMVVDKWRQCWNPGTSLYSVEMTAGKKYPIRIEWMPDGGESYLAIKWLGPLPGNDQQKFTLTSEAADQIDYYFIHGSKADNVIHGYRQLTGKAPIVPRWAMGLWQSRERYKSQDEILSTVKEFRTRHIPLDNIVLDWQYWKENKWGSQEFDPSRFPDPKGMISQLHDQYHTNFMISVWPKFYEGVENYQLFDKNGWLYKKNIANRQKDWVGPGYVSTFYDAFNPKARKSFWELIDKNLFDKGVDAWWMDATEPDILSNASITERKQLMNPTAMGSSTRYFNAFSVVNAMGIYEGQREANPDMRVFILTRSAYAGLQRYGAAVWSGDIGARWDDLKTQISAGINFSMSGIPYWTSDIGGFAVEKRFEHAKGEDLEEWREQMTRWFQFGAFSPLFRVHGQFPYREIFNTAPESHPAYKSMLYHDRLRYRLMPYLYSVAGRTYFEDYTIMRGLAMDFSMDEKIKSIGDQYMFGESLLVNPVYTYKATSRKVYLPASTGWYDLKTGKFMEGGQTITADAPISTIPVYVKEGSILPAGPAIEYTSEKLAGPITLYVYTGKDCSFTLYEDEGTNYNYEKGMYSNILFQFNNAGKTLTIAKRQGTFPGMTEQRIFRIVWVTREKGIDFTAESTADLEINYYGQEQIVHQQ